MASCICSVLTAVGRPSGHFGSSSHFHYAWYQVAILAQVAILGQVAILAQVAILVQVAILAQAAIVALFSFVVSLCLNYY